MGTLTMLTAKIGISAEEHDDFVKQSPQANLLQSSKWANIKAHWGNERIGFYENDTLVASASILIQPLPLGFTLLYIPRGPIMDYTNQALVTFVMKTLKAYGKTKRAIFIKYDPFLFLQQRQSTDNCQDNPETLLAIDHLTAAGAKWNGRTQTLAETIQPRLQANLYAHQFSLDGLAKKQRQAIRTARNKKITIVFGHRELLEPFSELMSKTEVRKKITLRDYAYYDKLLSTYGEDAYITMAFINGLEKKQEALLALEKLTADRSSYTDHTRQTKVAAAQKESDRLRADIAFFDRYLEQGKVQIPIAATLTINFGSTSENIYAGMDEAFRRYNPALLVWYETAKAAFERGALWHNLGGIENQLDGGLYGFKSKLNPTLEEFVGEFNLPVSPLLYTLANTAYYWRKKLRSKH